MAAPSFRKVPLQRVYPRPPGPGSAAAAIVIAAAVAGCGGGKVSQLAPTRLVEGPGFSFRAPADWKVTASPRVAAAAQGEALVSVTVFPLLRPYRPALWQGARRELDGVAAKLAARQGGRVEEADSVRLAGLPGRRYEIRYLRQGERFRQRVIFLLRGRRELQLLCRWREDEGEPPACALLAESFRLR
jgi:hypothetical protein